MGLVSSRLNLDRLHPGRRSQQDETLYSYSLNKNYFSNYFFMGGERFEVNDPDYLFGDNCDLNFLSCTKPFSLPYKQAQQYLLANLNSKQKAVNKVSSRVDRLSSSLNILTGRRRQTTNLMKQDAQTQTLHNSSKALAKGSKPSQPLLMFVNLRKETLRLVRSANNLDSEINILSNSMFQTEQKNTHIESSREGSNSKHSQRSSHVRKQQNSSHSAASSRATTITINHGEDFVDEDDGDHGPSGSCVKKLELDVGSILSTSSTRSGYTSVKEDARPSSSSASEDDDDDFKDALNDTTNLSVKEEEDGDSDRAQQQKSLLSEAKLTKENSDIKITIGPPDSNKNISASSNPSDIKTNPATGCYDGDEELATYSTPRIKRASRKRLTKSSPRMNSEIVADNSSNRVYNIEFNFDAEVDCSIRIFYFCTREITSSGISYKPQHATYKSKVYHYKKGLNQKFDQQEHTFQPYMFDEDLLIYKPLDLDGNYNSGAVFPIVIHCVASEGPTPRQSHSLVATIEKSQFDDSYSIKPLKQLIFVDGVQYILQDIYGIENKQLPTSTAQRRTSASRGIRDKNNHTDLRVKSRSLQSNLNVSNQNLSDTTSMASVDLGNRHNRGSIMSNQYRSLGSENTFECVICMSEDRDTMLLPCRHLCLCSSCAQSLRYQANSCPICRSPFKAALNLRHIQRNSQSTTSITTLTLVTSSSPTISTSATAPPNTRQRKQDSNKDNPPNSLAAAAAAAAAPSSCSSSTAASAKKTARRASSSANSIAAVNDGEAHNKYDETSRLRRESVTTSATPLLSPGSIGVVSNKAEGSDLGRSEGCASGNGFATTTT